MAGTGYYWGEVPLLAERMQADRTLGLEPDSALFRLQESAFLEWVAELDPDRFDFPDLKSVSVIVFQLKALIPLAPPGPGVKPPLVEELRIIEIDKDGVERSVEYAGMHLSQVRVLEDTEPRLVEVGLTDVRKFYPTHGKLITRNFNLRFPDGSIDQTTLNNTVKGEPITWVLSDLFRFLVAHLPGRPELVEFPPLTNTVVRPLRCFAARPVDVIRSVLADRLLVFSLNLDGTASIFQRGKGRIGEILQRGANAFETENHDPLTKEGIWAGQVIRDTFIRTQNPQAVQEVVIAGNRKTFTASVDYCLPVLILDADLSDGGRGQRTVPVTRDNLARIVVGRPPLAEGQLPPEGEAEVPDLTVAQFQALMRLPFSGAAWPLPLKDVTPNARDLLRAQLFRVWQVPPEFRHLLPMLDRAEFQRDSNGQRTSTRQEIVVEAYGFASCALDLVGELGSDAATAEEIEHQRKAERLAVINAKLEGLTELTFQDVADFVTNLVEQENDRPERAPLRFALPGTDFRFTVPVIETIADAVEAGIEIAEDVNEFMRRPLRELAAKITGGELPESSIEEERAKLEEEKRQLTPEIAALLAKINPERALKQQLDEIEAEIVRTEAAARGPLNLPLRARRRALLRQRDEVIAEKRAAASKLPKRKYMHANFGRRPADFRLLSRRQGIFEITSGLPGWLADPYVATREAAEFVVMPVRVLFGTNNNAIGFGEPSPPKESQTLRDALKDNEWTRDLPVAFTGVIFQMERMLGDTGHVVPREPGENRTAFTFSRKDRESGTAEVGDFPLSLVYADLKEFIGLPTPEFPQGDRNTEQILDQARAIADAILAEPDAIGSGELELRFPRRVNTSGRVTGIRHRSRPGGRGVNTIVSFQDPVAPLAGVIRARRVFDRVQEVFGIDVEAFK